MSTGTGYLTRTQAAERANVHPSTITRWLREGHLTKHPGRRGRYRLVLVDAAELERLMAATPVSDDS